MKSYIFYKGGQYGDLVFSIINNGVHLPNWIQAKLKNNYSFDDIKFKNFINRLPLSTITGCASFPLDWKLENYELICTNKDISAFTVTRLIKLNHNVDLKEVLCSYYPPELIDYVNNLTVEQATKLLIKKYQDSTPNAKINNNNLISINEIYNKEKFISELAAFFDFDIELANMQYDQWYERELPLLEQFFKTV